MRAWICWMLLELGLVARAAAGPDAGERLVYDVLLQGDATGKVEEFRRSDGALYAPRRLLQELGLAVPADAGEWVRLDAVTTLGPGSVGVATSEVHDELGPVARSAQTLLVVPR